MSDALAAPAGRRERRKADTRRRLLAAARALFVTRGYDATRPQDIARAADVAAGTFYLHFADKRAAFLAFAREAGDELLACTAARVAGARGFAELLDRALEALFEYSDANPGVLWAVSADAAVPSAELPGDASLRERLAETLAHSLREGIGCGEVPADYEPELVAHGVVGFVHHALLYGAKHQIDRATLLSDLKRFCRRALVRGDGAEAR